MDRTPPEILCDIFLKTLPYPIDPSNPPYSVSISAPLRISHVCRKWRDISLSYGDLWAYLCICYFSYDNQKRRDTVVEVFDTFLSRTNGAPLNYVFLFRSAQMAEAPRDVEHIFTMLLQNQHRWKNVVFSCHRAVFSPRFPGFNLTNMPLLTSMKLHSDWSSKPTADFTHSLRLRSLDVHHDTFDLVTDNLPSTLEQVRLSIAEPSAYPPQMAKIRSVLLCLAFLRADPYLRKLHVHSDRLDSISPLSNENRIVHSNLDELHLSAGIITKLPPMIIDAVTIPSLKTLFYVCNIGSETLLRFFQRSIPPLTKLHIECIDAREETFIGILRLLPTLKDLRLKYTTLSDWFFHQLTVPNQDNSFTGEHVICPGLSYLYLSRFSSFNLNQIAWLEPMLTMAKSRASALGTLDNVDFVTKDGDEHSVGVGDIDQYADLIHLGWLEFRSSFECDEDH